MANEQMKVIESIDDVIVGIASEMNEMLDNETNRRTISERTTIVKEYSEAIMRLAISRSLCAGEAGAEPKDIINNSKQYKMIGL